MSSHNALMDAVCYTGLSAFAGYGGYSLQLTGTAIDVAYGLLIGILTGMLFIAQHKQIEILEELVEVLGGEI